MLNRRYRRCGSAVCNAASPASLCIPDALPLYRRQWRPPTKAPCWRLRIWYAQKCSEAACGRAANQTACKSHDVAICSDTDPGGEQQQNGTKSYSHAPKVTAPFFLKNKELLNRERSGDLSRCKHISQDMVLVIYQYINTSGADRRNCNQHIHAPRQEEDGHHLHQLQRSSSRRDARNLGICDKRVDRVVAARTSSRREHDRKNAELPRTSTARGRRADRCTFRVAPIGSTANGFAERTSDLDVVVELTRSLAWRMELEPTEG